MNPMERVKTRPAQPHDRRAQMLNLPVKYLDSVHLGCPSRVLAGK